MRLISLLFLSMILLVGIPTQSFAQTPQSSQDKGFGDRLTVWKKRLFGVPRHDDTRPYLEEAKRPLNGQWNNEDWHPEYWVEDKGSIEAVMAGFYDAGIITDQYKDGASVLKVGRPFLRMSPIDQRHLVEFVDYAHQITSAQENGLFYIVLDERGHEVIGLYSQRGLQLQ